LGFGSTDDEGMTIVETHGVIVLSGWLHGLFG
jgi:hypothetical protein